MAGLTRRAGLSCISCSWRLPRTLPSARRFHDQTGASPVQWLLGARVRRAQELLETSDATVEQEAAATDFESSVTFRARFRRPHARGLPPPL